LGGCSTPISGYAKIVGEEIVFEGNILSRDGKQKRDINMHVPLSQANELGRIAGTALLQNGGQEILDGIKEIG
jgi:hydroxymethylbilane synthase